MTDLNNHFQGTEKASVAHPKQPYNPTPALMSRSFPTQAACSERARGSTSASPCSHHSRGATPVRASLLRTPGLAPPTCPRPAARLALIRSSSLALSCGLTEEHCATRWRRTRATQRKRYGVRPICGRTPPPAAPDIASHPSPAPSTQHPPPQPQPRHGKEDMWSPQSDFSDDSTLSQTQNVRPIGWLAPTPTSPHTSSPAPPATRARATGHSVTPRLAPPHSGAPWPSPARSS